MLAIAPTPDAPPLAAFGQLSKKPRQGFAILASTARPGFELANSFTAIGVAWNLASETRRATETGRFLSPDWNDDPVPVPYADLTNPQSLNLYAYVNNNPLSHVDQDGHSCDQGSVGPDGTFVFHCTNDPPPNPSGTLYRLAGTAAIGGEEFGPADWAVVGGLLAAASCAQTHCGSAIANFFSNMGNKPTPPVVGPAQSTPGDPNQNGKPKLVSNPKHHPNSNSPEPPNAKELYDKAIQDGQGRWWAKDADGTIHRFSAESNGETHWNGSTAGSNPIRMDNIPSEIRSALQ